MENTHTTTRFTARLSGVANMNDLAKMSHEVYARDIRAVPVSEGHVVLMGHAHTDNHEDIRDHFRAFSSLVTNLSMTTHTEDADKADRERAWKETD